MTFIQTVETDFKIAWGVIDGQIEKEALVVWNDVKTITTSLLPAEYAVLKGLVAKALADVVTGDFADIETNVLNQAEAAGHDFVTKLESGVLQALIALIKSL